MKKTLPIILLAAVIIAGGGFYGGMKYGQTKGLQGFAGGDFQELRNLSPEERQQRFQELGANADSASGGMRGASRIGLGGVAGEIIAKDEQSITVKLPDGGSKIVFFSDSTDIAKFATGTKDDLEVGETIMVNGKTNEDGTITAQSIQIRPAASQ